MNDLDAQFTRSVKPRIGVPSVVAIVLSCGTLVGLSYYATRAGNREREILAQADTVQKALKAESAAQKTKLAELERTESEQRGRYTEAKSQLDDLSTKLGAAESQLEELKEAGAVLSDREAEFKRLSKQFQRMVDSGKLSVSFRRGRMIVELPDAVLFASGSAELSKDGKQALDDVAKILRQVPSKRFMVGGHTDDVPLAKDQSKYSSNWALSAARAVTVTESLVDAGVKATRLVASGFGPYDPVASNASPQGRKKNRRIEIVLEPDLTQVPAALRTTEKNDKKKRKKK